MSPRNYDAIILGAGASGLYCAMHASLRGRRVAVLDHGPKAARKVRVAGGGKCNFTNLSVEAENYICANPHFCKSALARHGQWDFIEFISSAGIEYEEREDGQLFTLEGAGRIAGLLLERCRRSGVDIILNQPVEEVRGLSDEGFSVSGKGNNFCAPSLVVALGSPAWPQAGGSGLGHDLARQFGHNVIEPRPGLVPLRIGGKAGRICRELSGNALSVTIACSGRSFSSDLLFTHKGISGPAVLQISNYWKRGDELVVNLLPGMDLESLFERDRSEKVAVKNYLGRFMPKKLAAALLPEYGSEPVNRLGVRREREVAALIHGWKIRPEGTEGYSKAEVVLGGVDTDEVSSRTMESKKVPGLYFTGEVLDVTGWLGGYNLQWAWSSGFAASGFI